jgi:hypothetical protein
MAADARLKLELRLIPTEGEPNAALFDDLIRIIQRGIVTAPKDVPHVIASEEFQLPTGKSQNHLEANIKHRIEQASADSRKAVEKQQDDEAKRADESLEVARQGVAAVQRAIIRGVVVQVFDDTPPAADVR